MAGEPLFLWFFDAADSIAIDTIWRNLGLLPKSIVYDEMYQLMPKTLDFTALPQDSKMNLLPIYYF